MLILGSVHHRYSHEGLRDGWLYCYIENNSEAWLEFVSWLGRLASSGHMLRQIIQRLRRSSILLKPRFENIVITFSVHSGGVDKISKVI